MLITDTELRLIASAASIGDISQPDVGAGAHRDADVSLRERGGVVDAVAGHGHDMPLGLQAPSVTWVSARLDRVEPRRTRCHQRPLARCNRTRP